MSTDIDDVYFESENNLIFDSVSSPDESEVFTPNNPFNSKIVIRTLVRSIYAIQKLRIQIGNRISAAARLKLGLNPSQSEKEKKEAEKILKMYRASYKRITDGLKRELIPRSIAIPSDEIITHYIELVMVKQYDDLLRDEESQFKMLERVLLDFDIYNKFLSTTVGIGPAMSAVLISEIDISKSKYSSSLWKYAGLDVVNGFYRDNDLPHSKTSLAYFEYRPSNDEYEVIDESEDFSRFSLRNSCGELVGTYVFNGKGRSKRNEHLVNVKYSNREGEELTRKSITFNPFLKTKLMGVAVPSFLRCGNREYSKVYYDYKTRLKNRPDLTNCTDNHIHYMALRYTAKIFLIKLYENWRPLESLEVHRPYAESKLGLIHNSN